VDKYGPTGLRNVSTYIGIESPQKQCGKTTLLTLLSQLVCRPEIAANISPPAFFRVIAETQPTLLIDEGDTFLKRHGELRGIFFGEAFKRYIPISEWEAQKAEWQVEKEGQKSEPSIPKPDGGGGPPPTGALPEGGAAPPP
jgi:hypothetical protein